MGTSTEELNTDIARTRADLTRDVDALQDKVSPSAIVERRKSAMRSRLIGAKDKVMGAGQSVGHSVGQHSSDTSSGVTQRVEGSPLAAGLVAFGTGLVIAALVPATKVEAQGAQKLQEAAQPVVEEAQSTVRSAAQDVGAQLKDKASEAASEVKSSVQESASRVQDQATTSTPGNGSGTTGG